jgi:hypothetical protein
VDGVLLRRDPVLLTRWMLFSREEVGRCAEPTCVRFAICVGTGSDSVPIQKTMSLGCGLRPRRARSWLRALPDRNGIAHRDLPAA